MKTKTEKLANAVRAAGGAPRPEEHFCSAIIVAAGSGTRMGSTRTKQMTELCSKPVIVHTLLAFQACEAIKEIIVVAKEDELGTYTDFKRAYGLSKLRQVVSGGATRQESVMLGTKVLSYSSEYVAIHDGARCLITPNEITEVLRQACIYGAAAAAEKMTDTVKRCDGRGFVTETVDRNALMRAQTPQCFKTSQYLASAYTAERDGFEATDDCSVAEHAGFPVKMIDCGKTNLKITTPEDLVIARALLTARNLTARAADSHT